MDNASKSQGARPDPCLSAGALTLRPLTWRDIPFLIRLLRHAQVRRHLGGPVTWNRLPKSLKRHLTPVPGARIWCVRFGRNRLGLVYLEPARDGQSLELSFQFLPKAWGTGQTFQACAAVIAALPGPQITAETQSANAASRKLLSRLGFLKTGETERFNAPQTLYRLMR